MIYATFGGGCFILQKSQQLQSQDKIKPEKSSLIRCLGDVLDLAELKQHQILSDALTQRRLP